MNNLSSLPQFLSNNKEFLETSLPCETQRADLSWNPDAMGQDLREFCEPIPCVLSMLESGESMEIIKAHHLNPGCYIYKRKPHHGILSNNKLVLAPPSDWSPWGTDDQDPVIFFLDF